MSSVQKQRIGSIDILRGAVMLIMAIDHVRDYFHITAFTDDPTNLATTTPGLFFTRWITHFCAPIFVFLSGVSAFLASQRKTLHQGSAFLLKRGVWLLIVEVLIISLALTFNPLYNFLVFQVIWAIGWSMIILALLIHTNLRVITTVGFILVIGHNVLDFVHLPQQGAASILWSLAFTSPGRVIPFDANHFVLDAYAVLPWTGIMLLGYSFGSIYKKEHDTEKRKKKILLLGMGVIGLFFLLRFINFYGDPRPWSVQKRDLYTGLSFLNVTKYPVSLIYTCMTVGTALIALSLLERTKGAFSRVLSMFGRVPFFYYVCHFYLIRLINVVIFFAAGYGTKDIIDPNLPFLFRPQHFGFGLPVVYAIWLLVILILYKPCQWFDRYRSTHHQWWLSYL
ncbi:MAG: DUF1624 domain-containing protein [Williamsia sp.]|nr:DUF1624 domain-containing protein [Williamsia sp.]